MRGIFSSMHRGFLALFLVVGLTAPAYAERVLIRHPKPYGPVVSAIESSGGRVLYQYKHFEGLAAEVPESAMPEVRRLVGAAAVSKDLEIPAPLPNDRSRTPEGWTPQDGEAAMAFDAVEAMGLEEIAGLAEIAPDAYLINNALMNVSALHAGGFAGQGVVVAVIDSGIRPGFPHISLDGSVIGCEDFVGDVLGCSHFSNSGHGTFVAGMISANVNFTFAAASTLRQSVLAHCPTCFANPPTNTQIPMIGSAPLSSIYALRVFGPTGGAPTSRVLAALDRVLELRSLYDAGEPGGVNIQVVNMSLGGPTIFAGQDLFDTASDRVLENDMVLITSAGNTGPSSLTVGSPASALNAVSVGAASHAHNERILRDLQFGLGVGALYRPFSGTQTSYFSSRGPLADGRLAPHVTASGFGSYGQGTGSTTGTVSFISGTSFAAPSVSGVAALLRQAFPEATASQVRNALILSADPSLLTDGSTELDQGTGFVDGFAAFSLLAMGVPDAFPEPPHATKNVGVNVEQGSDLRVRRGFVVESATDLAPGERHELVYEILPTTRRLVVQLFNVSPALPPAEQNFFFGDDILLAVHSAKTSAISGSGDYLGFAFTDGGTFTFQDPEPGLVRITVSGDWTNAGTISANVAVFTDRTPFPGLTDQGRITDGGQLVIPVQIPIGVTEAQFRLGWRADWGRYPASDVDMFLFDPALNLLLSGATLRNPEVVTVNNPAPGTWLVVVDGFEIHADPDRYELQVIGDGRVIRK
jgi:subtilisin family serine protease